MYISKKIYILLLLKSRIYLPLELWIIIERLYKKNYILDLYKKYNNINEFLFCYTRKGHLEIVKYLVKNGADVRAKNDEALKWFVKNKNLNVVKYLVENGADVRAKNNEALRCSELNGYLEIVKYLIEQGGRCIELKMMKL